MENEALLLYYSKVFKDTDINIRGITAILISAISYLYLHKNKSAFCGIDLNTKSGRDELAGLLRTVVRRMFSGVDSGYADSRTVETARRMADKGMDIRTISEVLDLSEEDLREVLAEKEKAGPSPAE